MADPLPAGFFARPAAQVANDLLGMTLARRRRSRTTRWMILETEAYCGRGDRASHAHRGLTRRNAPMFGPARVWYVYRVYGLHWMLNVVTGLPGLPSAVLLRAAGPAEGPAGLTARLGIDGAWSGRRATRASGLWIEDGPPRSGVVRRLPRVGVDYAGPYWARRRLRFRLDPS